MGVLTTTRPDHPASLAGMHPTNDARGHLKLAQGGGEDLPAATTPAAAAPSSLLELLDAESRLLAQAVGEHLPLELALQVNELRARRAALQPR